MPGDVLSLTCSLALSLQINPGINYMESLVLLGLAGATGFEPAISCVTVG